MHTPRAEHQKMDSREVLAHEFFEVTGAEVIPFVSDDATWYDFDYLDDVELVMIVKAHYGVVLDEAKLACPFWETLDFLVATRTDSFRQ